MGNDGDDNDGRLLSTNMRGQQAPVRETARPVSKPQLSQPAWRRRMTRKEPVPSRPAATTAMAMLGPVVASADFVGVLLGAATAGVEDGLAGVPVLVVAFVVTVVAGADGVGAAAGEVVSVAGGATGAAGVVSVVGVDDVVSGVGCGAGVSDGGVSFVVVVLVVVVVVLLVVLVVWVSVVLLTL